MSILESVLWCLIPAYRRKRRREREKAARAELLQQKTSQLCHARASRNYVWRKDKILRDISFDHSRTVVIWPRGEDGARGDEDEVAEPLRTYEPRPVYVQDRWAVEDGGGGAMAWRGATLVFKTAQQAERAALELPLKIKKVESAILQSVVESIVDCELLHPEQKGRTSKVVIRREGAPPSEAVPLEEVDALHDALGGFGFLETFYVHNGPTTLGWYCEATYPHVTQTYVAALLTDGRRLGAGGGVYTAAVDRSDPRDGQILADARQCAALLTRTPFPPS